MNDSVSAKEHQALRKLWSDIVTASGSPSNEAAIHHVAATLKAFQELIDGQYPEDIQSFTGLPIERCEEIYRMGNVKVKMKEESYQTSTVCVDTVIRLLLKKAYCAEPMASEADCGQLVDGVWYMPIWGCDTLQYIVDRLRDMASK